MATSPMEGAATPQDAARAHGDAVHEFVVIQSSVPVDVERTEHGRSVRRQPGHEGIQVLVEQGALELLDG